MGNALNKPSRLKPGLDSLRDAFMNYMAKEMPVDSIFKNLSFIIIIRTFLEMLLEKPHSFKFNPDFYINMIGYTHGYLSWLCIFSTIAVLLAVFLELRLREALRLTLLFSPLILIPPVVDFIFTRGQGGEIFYGFEMDTFFYNYLNCFNPFREIKGITRGVRIEVLTAFLGSFYISFYVFKRGILRAIVLPISIYTAVFFYGYLPAVYKMLGADFYSLSGQAVSGITKSQKFLFMYLLPSCGVAGAIMGLLYKEDRENLKSAVSFIYPGRLVFYILLLAFGFLFISYGSGLYPQILNLEDAMKPFSAVISISLLFVYAKIINDIYDIEIDRVSNKERPLVKNSVSEESLNQLKNILLVLSFVFAVASEASFIFYWLFIWALSYVYSAPPLRLRRYYPLGHLSLSLIGMSVFLAGGALVKSYEVYTAIQDKEVLIYIFMAFFFLCHVKDFKDIEGDRQGGVYNILNHIKMPRAMGMIFISGFALSIYLIAGILGIVDIAAITGTILFLAGSVFYILKSKDIKKLDRLLLLSFLFSIYITALWLYQVAS